MADLQKQPAGAPARMIRRIYTREVGPFNEYMVAELSIIACRN